MVKSWRGDRMTAGGQKECLCPILLWCCVLEAAWIQTGISGSQPQWSIDSQAKEPVKSGGLNSVNVSHLKLELSDESSFLIPHERNTLLLGKSGLLSRPVCWNQHLTTEFQGPQSNPICSSLRGLCRKLLSGKALGVLSYDQIGGRFPSLHGKFSQRSSLISCFHLPLNCHYSCLEKKW